MFEKENGHYRISLGFDYGFFVDRTGISGGLDTTVSLLGYSSSHIDFSICIHNSIPFHFTDFYGNPKTDLRCFSWDLLPHLQVTSDLPWIVAGIVRSNLSSILDHLLKWGKKKYGNLTHSIKKTPLKLDALRSQPSWSVREESKLELELERLLSLEEYYWKT
ncbi:hypothetical protein M9H77_35836 [Catharanthus roseus]|uniref:Uncharacterized protein n=1 Tax=Catharanthus roseus TaxID=4058 RepID=A0ACB9ZRE3_CATRO|nr:hypothetical protein M9H77_35836 [Catharanthus roseus]